MLHLSPDERILLSGVLRSPDTLEPVGSTRSTKQPSISSAPVRYGARLRRHLLRRETRRRLHEAGRALSASPQVSSSSSTLSLLFGKRSFSSGLVISGLSAAEGGNTTDTQSSSSVNIAVGPSHRSSSRATQVRGQQVTIFFEGLFILVGFFK